ncbi:HpcH/HpaI aldolase/citrate lyase family protein [Enterovirga rhinocerotis]|uniref:Citrate lyase subunit beta/citryl-CoA lyase n=1 Tax=Enterovirga rhinocerotis TaxID=1339210 RepID=A0A4R7C4W8_9HYPH|nr:CoA ester lyase [Enterovirga rhinocerotis]TDR93211.1 citrate lyase subunit beta/citryl-CoA lyase [Enterovirga rhinocerotis]
MTIVRPRRSALYMPGSNARAVAKARTLPVDAVILDLEDSVAPDAKAAARDAVAAAVREGGFGSREVVIRVNGTATEWGRADLEAAIAAKPDAVLLPKVSSPAEIEAVEKAIPAGSATRIWAMIETPLAILHIDAIAAAARGGTSPFACMILGTNDLAKETRARLVPGRAPMLPWLALALAAGRAHGLDVLDGVYNDLKDLDGFRAECEQGRDLGMDGKTLIHPDQIAIANDVFAPPPAEIEAARAIIAAFALPENQGRGVISLNGRMVERLHAEMAERTVALADAIAASA